MKPKTKSPPASNATAAEMAQPPVFPRTMHTVRTRAAENIPGAKAPKRENTFSKSRDTREDRGERQMKTSRNAQTGHAR